MSDVTVTAPIGGHCHQHFAKLVDLTKIEDNRAKAVAALLEAAQGMRAVYTDLGTDFDHCLNEARGALDGHAKSLELIASSLKGG